MVKKGDTLIEVTLAIGIFSMIAIAVASVMNSGTSDAQLALETTLAREEIDAQADALRFIHNAYASNKEGTNQPLSQLWAKITDSNNVYASNADTTYNPTSCSVSDLPLMEKAFVLNTHNLNAGSGAYLSYGKDKSKFTTANTYPHLVFNNTGNSLYSPAWGAQIARAEGIYIVAVRDPSTYIVDVDGSAGSRSAYYDFYIRTCWYGAGETTPSTISTTIRLHNTDSAQSTLYDLTVAVYDENGNLVGPIKTGKTFNPPQLTKKGWEFLGYCTAKPTADGTCPGQIINQTITNIDDPSGQHYELYPVFQHIKYTIKYYPNGSSWSRPDEICYEDVSEGKCQIATDDITRSGYAFKGWCSGTVNGSNCSGTVYNKGDIIEAPGGFPSSRIINLTAIWQERNESITITLTWNSSTDYDSYIAGTKSDGSGFIASYHSKNPKETVNGVERILASLNHDCTGSCKDETFTINTLGGRNYYYYVRNYSSNTSVTGATVTVSGPYLGTYTFYSNNATGSGRIWNVFAYKDGKLVPRQTRSGGGTDSDGSYTSYDASY